MIKIKIWWQNGLTQKNMTRDQKMGKVKVLCNLKTMEVGQGQMWV